MLLIEGAEAPINDIDPVIVATCRSLQIQNRIAGSHHVPIDAGKLGLVPGILAHELLDQIHELASLILPDPLCAPQRACQELHCGMVTATAPTWLPRTQNT